MSYTLLCVEPRLLKGVMEVFSQRWPMLGIEISVPELATRCVLGNLRRDEQWVGCNECGVVLPLQLSRGGLCGRCGHINTSPVSPEHPAISWPLPPEGAVLLVTERSMFSFGAMAMLVMRADTRDAALAAAGTGELLDGVDPESWKPDADVATRLKLTTSEEAMSALPKYAELRTALAKQVSEAVEVMRTWLETGKVPSSEKGE